MRQRKNRKSRPPADESITLRCLCAVEFYSPSHLDELEKRFFKLGWAERDMFQPEDPLSWLSRSRRDGHLGWKTLGYIVDRRNKDVDLPGLTRIVPLPSGVDHAHAIMGLITPSLGVLAVCFTFNSQRSTVFERALQTDRKPISKKTRTGWRHYLPGSQKYHHLHQIRQDLVELSTGWFRKYLPGLFSSGQLHGGVPTCEFLTFRKVTPIPSPQERGPDAPLYLMMLGVYWGNDAWIDARNPGVKFNLPHSIFFGPPNHCVLTAKESEIDTGSGHHYEHMLRTILSAVGLLPLLIGYEYRMRKIRDSTAAASVRAKDVATVLKEMAASDSIDMLAVMSELAAGQGSWLLRRLIELKPKEIKSQRAESLKQLVHNIVKGSAPRLQEIHRETREQLAQFGSLLGARENILLQRKIKFLTWILIVLAIMSVVPEAISLLAEIYDLSAISKFVDSLVSKVR